MPNAAATRDFFFEALEAPIDARFDRLEYVLTFRMIVILGAWTLLVGWTFTLTSILLR